MEGPLGKDSYFKFCKAADRPVFIKLLAGDHTGNIKTFLQQALFFELKEDEVKKVEDELKKDNAKILVIEPLSSIMGHKIKSMSYLSSQYDGKESISSHQNHYLYRYQQQALLIYSFYSKEWKLGVGDKFAVDEVMSRVVINRFLSWALSPFSCLGIWGTYVDGKINISNCSESEGRAVFLHVEDGQIFLDGQNLAKVNDFFRLAKEEVFLREEKKMGKEEIYGLVMARSTYFHSNGMSSSMRKLIYQFASITQGKRMPSSSYSQITQVRIDQENLSS